MGLYKSMVVSAKEDGITDEGKMWAEIDNVDGLLECIKAEHPNMYWKYIRNTHETLNGKHYDEKFGVYDVSKIHYTDRDGQKRYGAHWSPQEVISATQAKKHPNDVTIWDRYVAYNVFYADLCIGFDDEQILKAAYLFFFNDEDWSENGSSGKVWEYMQKKQH